MIKKDLFAIFKNAELLYPEWFLVLGMVVILIFSIFRNKGSQKNPIFEITIFFILGFTYLVTFYYPSILKQQDSQKLFYGLITLDSQAIFYKQLIAISAVILLAHIRILKYTFEDEIYFILLCLVFGLSILSSTTHFIVIFISLELVSLSTYVWVAHSKNKAAYEASIKYLIFGAIVTAIMLLGVSYFYGITHSLDFSSFNTKLFADQNPVLITILSIMFLGSFLFKVGAVPFHSWLPDVYETTATPLLSFLSFAPKAIGFCLISRFISTEISDFNLVLAFLILASLVIGNLSALWQVNAKRMLGFSGIAQAGFMLLGLIVRKDVDLYSLNFYVTTYLPISMSSFLLLDILYKKSKSYLIDDYLGLGQKYPILAVNAIIIMMALIGLPPTLGFSAKLLIFGTLVEQGNKISEIFKYGLLIFGLLNMAVSIYYYLRIPYQMLIAKNKEIASKETIDFPMVLLSYFSALLVIAFLFTEYIGLLVMKSLN